MKSAVFRHVEARRLLDGQGMFGYELAEAVGVSEAAVSSYLSGKLQPSSKVYSRICAALGVGHTELCTPRDEPDPAPAAAPTSRASA